MNDNLSEHLGGLYQPISALLIYKQQTGQFRENCFVEHYDIDPTGKAVNAHPLTVQESEKLVAALKLSTSGKRAHQLHKTILPPNILYVDNEPSGAVVWYTKKMSIPLFFTESLGIKCGVANIPALVWKVQAKKLSVYALTSDQRPKEGTKLYYAPFFNIHVDGKVCLGTVNIKTENVTKIENLMDTWQEFFFNSRFSHVLNNPINGNCVLLWKDLVGSGKSFPKKVLKSAQITLMDILK
ncbi:hypothetical protein D3C71_26720 [compost metagenome]